MPRGDPNWLPSGSCSWSTGVLPGWPPQKDSRCTHPDPGHLFGRRSLWNSPPPPLAVEGGTSQTFGTVAHGSLVTYAPPLTPTPVALGLSCWQWLARAQQLGSCRGVLPQLPQAEPGDSTGSSPTRMFPSAWNSGQEVGQLPAWHALQAHAPDTQPSTPSSISAPGPLSSQGPWWRFLGFAAYFSCIQKQCKGNWRQNKRHSQLTSPPAPPWPSQSRWCCALPITTAGTANTQGCTQLPVSCSTRQSSAN